LYVRARCRVRSTADGPASSARSRSPEDGVEEPFDRRHRRLEVAFGETWHVLRHAGIPGPPPGGVRRAEYRGQLDASATRLGCQRRPQRFGRHRLRVRHDGQVDQIAVAGAGLGRTTDSRVQLDQRAHLVGDVVNDADRLARFGYRCASQLCLV